MISRLSVSRAFMNWILYAIIAIFLIGISDLFRKLASNLKDPFFTNFSFQVGAITVGVILFLLFSRKIENNPRDIAFAFIGGSVVSLFSFFSFKALALGPGVSTVMPVLRIGGVAFVAFLGVTVLRERLSLQTFAGLVFSVLGIYLLFTNK